MVEDCTAMRYLDGLPIVKIKSWGLVNSLDWIQQKYYETISRFKDESCLDKAKLSYWKKEIRTTLNEVS